jgi:phenylpropionate dioxygenase-like ring-hydroxylating dioxygenase large terminal subunit
MAFARNHWYVIASTDEIDQPDAGPLGRIVCDVPIVVFRDATGTVTALSDRCSHRRFPLSRGRVNEGVLICGYHGFSYDGSGTCVAVPGQETIPSRADVQPFPVLVRGPWIFVWPGDPAIADESALPALPWVDDAGWVEVHGMRPLAARYELLIDNLLDLSHETYLHAGFIGTPEVASTPIDTTVDEAAGIVRVSRHMSSVACPPFYEKSTGMSSPIDRWQDIEYHPPGVYILHSRIAPVGLPPEDEHLAAHVKVLYGITPATATSTYDFWLVARDFALDDAGVSTFMEHMNDQVVMQDVVALDELERRISIDPNPFEVNIKIDRGGLQARRMVSQLIEMENEAV